MAEVCLCVCVPEMCGVCMHECVGCPWCGGNAHLSNRVALAEVYLCLCLCVCVLCIHECVECLWCGANVNLYNRAALAEICVCVCECMRVWPSVCRSQDGAEALRCG